MDTYNQFEIFKKVGITTAHRIAWFEENVDTREVDKFVESVLFNRGFYQAKLFSDFPEAKKWLIGEKHA